MTDFIWKSITCIGPLRGGNLELALKHQGEEEMITYLNTLCVPTVMMGVIKFCSLPDSWSNHDTSVLLALLCVFLVCAWGYKETNI